MESNPKRLIVYSASAGSGKTYTLTGAYLRLLFQGLIDTRGKEAKYNRILAATFTNKATIELKERILALLYEISTGASNRTAELVASLEWKGTPESEKEPLLRKYAHTALREILQNYTFFRVQTIDSFFQEIVRSFTLELSSIDGGFEVEIDNDTVLELTYERLIDQLQQKKQKEMLQILKGIFQESMEEGERIQLQKRLLFLSKRFVESQENSDQLQRLKERYLDTNLVLEVQNRLKEIKQKATATIESSFKATLNKITELRKYHLFDPKKTMRGCLATLLKTLEESEPSDLLEKFKKEGTIMNETLRKIIEEGESWYPKSKAKEEAPHFDPIADELRLAITPLLSLTNERCDLITASMMLQNLRWIPAILRFKECLDDFQEEKNIILITEINQLLHDIIDGSDLPFIYDKVGTQIDHYMLDEFQDTNHKQWDNFRPLLLNALAEDHTNYLVGDVKQSIYRFRGAESSLLGVTIPKYRETALHRLEHNYRSAPEIVEFNNKFFSNLYNYEQFYQTAEQGASSPDFGYVYTTENVQQISAKADPQEVGYVQALCLKGEVTPEEIRDVLLEVYDDGYSPGDIVFLVRRVSEASKIAGYLQFLSEAYPQETDHYTFISSEALLINSSATVQLLSNYIHTIAYPEERGNSTLLNLSIASYLSKTTDDASCIAFRSEIDELAQVGLSIYETITTFLSRLEKYTSLPRKEFIYISAFQDKLFQYTNRGEATYRQFDQWWQQKKNSLCIEMSQDACNAIQIITIHKSKGLEFPVVIMPFASWDFQMRGGHNNVALFSIPSTLPKNYPTELEYYYLPETVDKSSLASHFSAQYEKKRKETYLDNLNLLYVAFTRASRQLYIFTKQTTEKSENVARVINSRLNLSVDGQPFTSGHHHPTNTKRKEHISYDLTKLAALPQYEELTFISKKWDSPSTLFGSALHKAMAQVFNLSDFNKQIDRLSISSEEDKVALHELIHNFKTSTQTAPCQEWFTRYTENGWYVLNEIAFYSPTEQKQLRADRVLLHYENKEAIIIDYKFGETSKSHHKQIRGYAKVLQEMGYRVKAYLWYQFKYVEQITLE